MAHFVRGTGYGRRRHEAKPRIPQRSQLRFVSETAKTNQQEVGWPIAVAVDGVSGRGDWPAQHNDCGCFGGSEINETTGRKQSDPVAQ
jgi:hypothetical protein